ncbi:uncharacterized protein LOC143878377 [Tasmannia lanceolata]|uniref:uncharacterized protein LOC143878377 n=1 Tax=Tasmannia lanceolata TaxID=3420 RepID=UPI004064A826
MKEIKDLISMNTENPSDKSSTMSLFQGEELFFNKLLSRDMSKGLSSRIYYQVAGKIPFDWETRPGEPKNPPESKPLPQLSPPPAVLSSRLAHRCSPRSKGVSNRLSLWFWKKLKKSQQSQSQMGSEDGPSIDPVDSFGFWSGGDSMSDSMSSPRNSSSSSSLSSFDSSSPSSKLPVPKSQKCAMPAKVSGRSRRIEGLDWAWRCTRLNFSRAMVCMAREV